jgi:hypothetical protein
MYVCLERSFVKPIVKDFLTERKSGGEIVDDFHLGGRIPPPKPLGFEGGINMGGCHLLEVLNCHICDEEGGKMMVNLQHIRVLLMSLSWALVIVFQNLGADLSDSGVFSQYNLAAVLAASDKSL